MVERMTTPETAGSRLLDLLQRLPGWSKTLDAIQIRILAEGIASLYRQMVGGLRIDEDDLSDFVDQLPNSGLDELPPEALQQLARMGVMCRAPEAFVKALSADSLFESLIRQLDQLCNRIELGAGTYAWKLYMSIHELETCSRSIGLAAMVDIARLVSGIYLRIESNLMSETSQFDDNVPEGWFLMLSTELRKLAARIVVICLNPDDYLNERLPRAMYEERFRTEADRVTAFLLEARTMAP